MNDDEDTEDPSLTGLNEEEEIVFNLVWDSGAPLPGAGHEVIYRLEASIGDVTTTTKLMVPTAPWLKLWTLAR